MQPFSQKYINTAISAFITETLHVWTFRRDNCLILRLIQAGHVVHRLKL